MTEIVLLAVDLEAAVRGSRLVNNMRATHFPFRLPLGKVDHRFLRSAQIKGRGDSQSPRGSMQLEFADE
jgi:hypothetical protein